jgi:hypothetical protein
VHCGENVARLVCQVGCFWDESMASCIRGLSSPGFCSEMSFPSLWRDCMKKCSYGVSREVVLMGFGRDSLVHRSVVMSIVEDM